MRTPKVRHAAVKYLSKRTKRLVIEEEEENAPESDEEDLPIAPAKQEVQASFEAKEQNASSPGSVPEETGAQVLSHQDKSEVLNKDDDTVIVEDDAVTIPNSDISEPKKLETEENIPELEEDLDPEDPKIEYPNKSSLVINALIAGLEDENTLVQRITLDYMHTHFKLSCELFTESEKCILVEATLRLLIRKDLSLTRRIYTWMFGPPDLENKYQITEKNQ